MNELITNPFAVDRLIDPQELSNIIDDIKLRTENTLQPKDYYRLYAKIQIPMVSVLGPILLAVASDMEEGPSGY